MLYFTRWRALGIILIALMVCLCAVPNFFPESTVKGWPQWAQRRLVARPRPAGRLLPAARGRFQLCQKEKLEQIRDDCAPRAARGEDLLYGGVAVHGEAVEVRITKETDVPAALSKLRDLSQPLGGLLGSNGQRSLDVSDAGGGLIRLTVPQGRDHDRIRQTIEQSSRSWSAGSTSSAPSNP